MSTVSGIALYCIMIVIFVFALTAVRKQAYRFFWLTHQAGRLSHPNHSCQLLLVRLLLLSGIFIFLFGFLPVRDPKHFVRFFKGSSI
jgi:hypothetical protein